VATAETGSVDSGDTAWLLVSTAFVLFMTIPGLFLLYAGLVASNACDTSWHEAADRSPCLGVSAPSQRQHDERTGEATEG
jgi:hypothetical protein